MKGRQKKRLILRRFQALERETGFEPATSTLARLHSTTELFPLNSSTSQLSKDHIFVKTKLAASGRYQLVHGSIGQVLGSRIRGHGLEVMGHRSLPITHDLSPIT
jgi:hypothetical protein